jgi:hypothetical protein
MERSRDYDDIAVALAEARPSPRPDFTAELDALVASGFQPTPNGRRNPLTALASRLRGLSPQRLLFSAGGTALAAIAIATVIVAGSDHGQPPAFNQPATEQSSNGQLLDGFKPFSRSSKPQSTGSAESEYRAAEGVVSSAGLAQPSRGRGREIERAAEIGLLADPTDVANDSAAVFATVHETHGIVLHSTTTSGRRAGAHFDLLIPSARLGDALAAFSAIDEVRTRHKATTDITAPTVGLEELLRDSRAKVDGLLSQLAATETESEREAIEIGLRHERRHAAVLRTRLDKLRNRADYSRVSLRIESSASAADSAGGSWGVDDAFHDAGHILGIAAGVTLIALAVIAPIALILLLAWLAHRLWLRARRERALDA